MMPLLKHLLLVFCLAGCCSLCAQVKLKNRIIQPVANVYEFDFAASLNKNKETGNKIFCILHFKNTVTETQKQELARSGIQLFHYIPDNAYTAAISQPVSVDYLASQQVNSIFDMLPEDKLSRRLSGNNIPAWSIKKPGTVDVIVHFSKAIDPLHASGYFLHQSYDVIDNSWQQYHFLTLRIAHNKIYELASVPFVEFIEPIAPDPKNLNYLLRTNTRANVLNAPVSSGGEGLLGKGVTIGIGDDADPSDHVDLADRVINHAAAPQQTHGTHVAGIAAGGGLKDPQFQGIAPQATVVSQLFNGIFLNAAAYIADYHMVVTNNSWGNITGECDLTGVYDTYSKLLDDISIQFPYLLNIFAAGNDGPYTCLGYPQQYHTIVSGHQSAKNVLSVGWAEKNLAVSPQSSIGPTADGRLKPELVSQGSGVRSTAPKHEYFTDWGTSMAAPSVAGGAALLIEKYRMMNAGTDPKSGLVKALLMNGATDIANPAPDHKSGYGFLHLVRSLDMLKNNRYIISSVNNNGTNNHSITIPAGIARLKVMIYWHDPSAAIFAQKALVNDLDLEVITPTASVVLPWKLTSDSNNATATAVRAADHINNSEQVTIDNPAAGNYTVKVNGTSINMGATQEYFIVYDLLPAGVDLTYPSVGEPIIPNENIVITWDAWGTPSNTFTLQYSTDNGGTWTDINNAIGASERQYNWIVPIIVTDKAKVRLIQNGTGFSDESLPFTIIAQSPVSLASIQCEDHINLEWIGVNGATDYEVMMKQGTEMKSVATTTGTNYLFSGLNKDSVYWVSVRPRVNGNPGRRSVAVSRMPDNGSCAGNISDNDLKLDSIISPVTGRKSTSTEIVSGNLSVRIKNIDDAAVTGFSIQFAINGGPFITQNVSATIPGNGTYVHHFTGLDFSTPGDYAVIAIVKNNNFDDNPGNDTFRTTIRQIPNPPLSLPYSEDFDAVPAFEITKDITGLPGIDNWDFSNTTDTGRIRSFVNTGIARSGNRAITLDTKRFSLSGNTNFFTGTFNLANYAFIFPDELGLKLEFSYKHHGQKPHASNKVWARRSDTDPWIQVFDLDSISLRPGEWKTVLVDLSKTPAALSLTSSFQVRFGQHGHLPMGDDITGNGLTIDDIRLFAAPSDVALIAIDSPMNHSCNLGTSVPLKIRYVTSRPMPGCIPVKYQLNGGPVVSECAPGFSNTYTFTNKLNLSSYGTHILTVWLDDFGDNYKKNDSIQNYLIHNKPVISTFPYIEDFENGPGNWHAEGYKSSWEYGTPASLKIRTASSGTKAWKTKLTGQYNENELSYLHSPCFDISALSSPFLDFKMALDMEQCGVFVCDKLWIEYTADGKTWAKLGTYGQGINWYNNKNENVWDSVGFTAWHHAGIALPAGLNIIQLRFVLQSDAGVTREGVAIDDVQMLDQQVTNDPTWNVNPNPASSFAEITSFHPSGSKVNILLFDITGRKVYQEQFTATGLAEKHRLTTAHLAKGIYTLKIDDGSNSKVFKLVKH